MDQQPSNDVLHTKKIRPIFFKSQEVAFSKPPQLPLKRLFDIIFSLTIIVFLLSWLIPILAILIKLNSKGPVFFIQKRIGALGKPFYCLKLRTMVINAQANTKQAEANDPRITSIGKFLRDSNLDELPQFFNVLLGDMSIVGPRPHMLKDCEEFSKIIKNYNSRNTLRPGITGMAQVKGYRGKTDDYFDVFHRYKWDLFYVRNASLKLDLKIIRLTATSTFKACFFRFVSHKPKPRPIYFIYNPKEASKYLN